MVARKTVAGLLAACLFRGAGAQTEVLPQRTDDNLIVASYNIKWFGHNEHDLAKLASVIQHFDVCGVVELQGEQELHSLREALESLTGEKWGYTYGMRTPAPDAKYYEAYGVLWRRDRVELGDGPISAIWDSNDVFRHDPFVVSFRRRKFDFSLVLIHTRWTTEQGRAKEVAEVARQVSSLREHLPEKDLILAGDFNYPGASMEMKGMANALGMSQLDKDPKTTHKQNGSSYASAYDHFYATVNLTKEYITGSCDALDATKVAYGDGSPATMIKSSKELSDHLPVFAIFRTDLPDDD